MYSHNNLKQTQNSSITEIYFYELKIIYIYIYNYINVELFHKDYPKTSDLYKFEIYKQI